MTVQNVFIPDFPVVLTSLKSSFCSSELSCFEHGTNHASLTAWPILNVYHFQFGKETLNPRFGTKQPLSLIPSKPLIVEFAISNWLCNVYVQWPMRVVVGSLQGLEAPEIPWLGVGGESFP
jgi:hypothetical protein